MRLPASQRDNLFTDGTSMRMWRDTKSKLRRLAGIRRLTMAETLDQVIHQALEDALTQEEEASNERTEL
jgi:hypothetical protein